MRHVSDRFAAVLDANVLYPFLVRDVLLSLAQAGLYRPHWTAEINDEWSLHLIEAKPEKEAAIRATVTLMNAAFPEALVENYEALIPAVQLPDADDRHVLAAAIRARANVIVTENTKDFPAEALARYDIEVLTADDFILNTVELYLTDSLQALKKMRARYRNPPRSPEELVTGFLRCGLVATAAAIAPHLQST